jgi:hypothetical protein
MMHRTVRRPLLAAALIAALVLVGWLYVAFEPHRETRRLRQAKFSFLTVGVPRAAVLGKAGAPNQTCRGGESVRLLKGQLPDARTWSVDEGEVLRRLERQTAEVLVYYFPEPSSERGHISCGPAYLDTAVGLDSAGSVLWFTILRGEDIVRHGLLGRPARPQHPSPS